MRVPPENRDTARAIGGPAANGHATLHDEYTFFTTSAVPTSHSDSRTGTRQHACVLCASLSRALVKQTRREKEGWEEKVEGWKVLGLQDIIKIT